MNKKRILVAILSLALCVCSAFGLMACQKEHIHDFATTYKTNAEQHWKECECGEKSELGNHVFDDGTVLGDKIKYVCYCGYEKLENYIPQEKSLMELFNSLSETDFMDQMNVVLDGDVFAEDVEIPYYTEADYNGEELVVVDMTGTVDGEIYLDINDGKIQLNGAILADVIGKDENQVDFFKLTAEAYIIVVDEVIYLKYDVDGSFPGLDNNLQEIEGNYIASAGQMSISFEEIINMIPQENMGLISMISVIIEENKDFIIDELVPLFDRICGDVYDMVEKIIEANIESTFTANKVEDKYEVVYDFDKIKANADKLFDMSMAEYIDETLGEGAFEELKNDVVGILDIKLIEVLDYLFTTDGLTLKELEDKINEIGKAFDPEFDLAKSLNIEGSLEEFIQTQPVQEMLFMTVGEVIIMFAMPSDPEIEVMAENVPNVSEQVEELKAMIISVFDMAGDMTFYDAIMMLVPPTDVDPEIMKEQVKGMTGLILDVAKNVFNYKIIFDEDGKFEKMVVGYAVEQETIDLINSLLPPEAHNVIVGGGSVVATISLGEFANALEIDYDAIIAGFAQAA